MPRPASSLARMAYADALSGIGQDSLAVVQYELAASKYPENGDLLKNLSTVYSGFRRR